VQHSQGLDSLMAGLDPQALDLLKKLLVFSSDQRISAGKALLHPYFRCSNNYFQITIMIIIIII